LTCLAAVFCVLAVNTFLGAGLNLSVPYALVIKYSYQALPFISLLSASLIPKSVLLLEKVPLRKNKISKIIHASVGVIGIILIIATLIYNLNYFQLYSTVDGVSFPEKGNEKNAYWFTNTNPVTPSSTAWNLQYMGITIFVLGIIWLSRYKIRRLPPTIQTIKNRSNQDNALA
jgi:hypothetical protein